MSKKQLRDKYIHTTVRTNMNWHYPQSIKEILVVLPLHTKSITLTRTKLEKNYPQNWNTFQKLYYPSSKVFRLKIPNKTNCKKKVLWSVLLQLRRDDVKKVSQMSPIMELSFHPKNFEIYRHTIMQLHRLVDSVKKQDDFWT